VLTYSSSYQYKYISFFTPAKSLIMIRKSLLLLILLYSFGIAVVQAQNLIIRFTDGTENADQLSSLQKLSFDSGSLVISYKNGSTALYALPEIQKLYFGAITLIPDEPAATENSMSIYPNPALNEIHLENIPAGTSMIFIYRMDGKLVMQQPAKVSTELINISNLECGLYLLVANTKTAKFIKQ